MGRHVLRVPEDLWPTRKDWSGRLVSWLVGVGEKVLRGQAVAEVEVEKAVLEILSPCTGVLTEKLVNPGSPVRPGTPIGVLEDASC